MKEINLNNYEAFFLDYCEKRLSAVEVAELILFLEHHPELRSELEEYEEIRLTEEKSALSIDPGKISFPRRITAGNCEDYFISSIEGQLSAAEQEQLELFLIQHPEYKRDYELYKLTILPKEEDNIVLNTAGLYQIMEGGMQVDHPVKEKRRRFMIIKMPAYAYLAAAASVVLLVAIWFFISTQDQHGSVLAGRSNYVPTTEDPNPVAGAQVLNKAVVKSAGKKTDTPASRRHEIKSYRPNAVDETAAAENVLAISPLSALPAYTYQTLGMAAPREPEPVMALVQLPVTANTISGPARGEQEFPNLGRFAVSKILPGLEPEVLAGKEKTHIGLAITKMAVRTFNRFSGRKIKIRENFDESGTLVSYAINSGSFEYAHALNH